MSTNLPPAEAIASALFRLRGRRPHHQRDRRDFSSNAQDTQHRDPERDRDRGLNHDHDHDHEQIGALGRTARGRSASGFDHHGGHGRGRELSRGGMAWLRLLETLGSAAGPLSISELGEAIGVDQPRASRLVQQAVERDMARREADPSDARRTNIALTDAGREAARRMMHDRRKPVERALTALDTQEQHDLARLLTKLADNWPT